jgi:hypothetical protein
MVESTYRQAMKTDEVFNKACELSGAVVSRRQYSHYKLGRGKAFSKKQEALKPKVDIVGEKPAENVVVTGINSITPTITLNI